MENNLAFTFLSHFIFLVQVVQIDKCAHKIGRRQGVSTESNPGKTQFLLQQLLERVNDRMMEHQQALVTQSEAGSRTFQLGWLQFYN